jgi:ABC-type cobalamin/Fe3+-siderophores transport system ATPase subunit
MMDVPFILQGPAGCGKSFLLLQVAGIVGQQDGVVELNLDEQVDSKTLIGRIFKEDRSVFIIQNIASGSSSDNSDDWRVYGSQSWNVSSGDYSGTPRILIPKNIDVDSDVEDEKVDPYTWNAPLEIRNLSLLNTANVKSILSDAHFAIVLDYLELKKSGFKTKQSISTEREETKAGATAFIKDEEVKRANINRYMDELAKRVKIEPDLANISNLVFRYFGLGKFGYYVLRGRHFSDFNSILSYLYKFLKEEDKEYYYNQIIENIKYKSKVNSEFNIESEAILKRFFDKASSEKKKLMPKLEELNSVIYNRFKSFEIENIDDLDLFYNKMLSLRRIWKESDRFPYTKKLYYLVENMSDEYRVGRYLNDIDDSQVPKILEEMDRFINLSKKI